MAGLRVTEDELRHLLVERLEVMDRAEFDRARTMASRLRVPIERVIVERGRLPFGFLLNQLADAWGIAFVDLKVSDVQPEALHLLPEEYARRHVLVPFAVTDDRLRVAMWDPRDRVVIDDIEQATKRRVDPVLAPDTAIARAQLLYKVELRALLDHTRSEEVSQAWAGRATVGADERSVIELLDRILQYAALTRASDIHIEPYELEGVVRYRVDSLLREVLTLPSSVLPALIARVKVLASLRIDERRAPQDGRFDVDLSGLKMDIRVSTLPTHWGEKLALRVLAKENLHFDLEGLGLTPDGYDVVLRNILRPYGMVLVTGPTGSGKSTTLYAMLIRLGAERSNVMNISTIEDPIEYTIPRVNQTAVNPLAGMEFATGLRALLRQDPDVIMVGEIRDRETVETAVRAALVGRLLLSTLHTNDASGTIARLSDMGVEPYLIASTLALVIGQRLVRRVCMNCRESAPDEAAALNALRQRPDFESTVRVLQAQGVLGTGTDPLAGVRLFLGKGCAQCGGSGFRGRLGVFELLEIDDQIRAMIMTRRETEAIREAAVARGMKTMFEDGLAKAFLGETTLAEVFRVAL